MDRMSDGCGMGDGHEGYEGYDVHVDTIFYEKLNRPQVQGSSPVFMTS